MSGTSNKKDWIAGYEAAYRSIRRVTDKLYFLAEIIHNESGNGLVLSCAAEDGLSAILASIRNELEEAQCNNLPLPADFADMVGGGNE